MTKNKIGWEAILFAGLVLAMIISPLADFGGRCAQVRDEVLRLHILANSDSEADQALKLEVRDAILAELGEEFGSADNLEEARKIAEQNLSRVEEIAAGVIADAGRSDSVQVQTVRMYFDTRVYENATLPAGEYEALRVLIGEGAGKNWWCVMFPPLCIPAAAREGDGEIEDIMLLEEEPNYKLAFWSVEAVEELLQLAGN